MKLRTEVRRAPDWRPDEPTSRGPNETTNGAPTKVQMEVERIYEWRSEELTKDDSTNGARMNL